MVSEDLAQQLVGTLLELVNDSVVQGVLVLLQPASDVVRHLAPDKVASQPGTTVHYWQRVSQSDTHSAGIVTNGEVGSLLAGLWRLGLLEVGRLAQVVVHQLLLKGLVGGLGEHRLFLKDGEDTHGLQGGRATS